MRSVFLKFKPDVVLEVQDGILGQIRTWDSTVKAGRLKPEAKQPEILRMCCVYVEENADVSNMIQRLAKIPEVESAFVPAERHCL